MKPVADYAYTKLLEEQLSSNVRYFEDIRQPLNGLRHAAVALAVYDCQGEASVVVTRRSHSLREHSGQWALPGGRIDDGESPTDAALRELHEEVNLELGEESVIGTLDDYVTRSGYVITPVVVWADIDDRHLKANPDEVASIHPFTFTELSRKDSPNLETIPESDRQVLSMNYFDDVLYAPTAAMLYQFREVALSGRSTRVLDYDQPVFAWR
jgi:8-oxo-dGTP pyrophosphatase MutT (NUDIX family)|tara:strand:- start:572 stop:1207 length:636 start_codon:yes stop_codon:yes gene_type:complete